MYHVLNRGVGRMKVFEKEADYIAFEKVLEETWERTGIRILSYCVMPNHILCGAAHNTGTCYSGRVRTENFPR